MSDIHVACIVGDMENVKSFDNKEKSILRTTDNYGRAAIHYAAYEPNILSMIVQRVRRKREILNLRDARGNTVLHHCVISGCVDSVKHVVGVPECNVNQLNDEGDAPLHVACKRKDTAVVQLLVANKKCNLNIFNNEGDTALHIAAYIESNGIQIVRCLLRSGKCNLNQLNAWYETPLHVACKYKHSKVVEMLIANGADLHAVDMDGNTVFHIACHNLQFNCLRLLREHFNEVNADGDTGLHIVCGMNNISKEKLPELVKFLRVIRDIDINKFNKNGDTPLHIACRQSDGDVVGALVALECDVNTCDGLGNTALHIAVNSRIDELQKVRYLLQS